MPGCAPVTDAAPHQDATLSKVSLATNSTLQGPVSNETSPPKNEPSGTASESFEQDSTRLQNYPAIQSKAVVASSNFVWYRSAAIQTLPPSNAEEFEKIYGRQPTNQELVSKVGSAAIGHYVPGLSSNPHDIVSSKPFAITTVPERTPNYADSSFQTSDVAQCNKALLRAKVKASLLVNKQRDGARAAGFRVCSETRDEYIVHSEQLPINLQFDTKGNAIGTNVDGYSLPNIYGEEISIGREAKDYTSSAVMTFTPLPTPLPPPVHDSVTEMSTPQRIRALEPHVPSDKSDPPPIEWYGYIERIPIQDTVRIDGGEVELAKPIGSRLSDQKAAREERDRLGEVRKSEETMLVIGGERFADKYIVYDATAPNHPSSSTTSDANSDMSKKRILEDEWEMKMSTSSPKRTKASPKLTSCLDLSTSSPGDCLARHQGRFAERNDAKGSHIDYREIGEEETPHRAHEDKAGARGEQSDANTSAQRGFRRRSRSHGGGHVVRCESRSSVERQSEDPYEEEGQRHNAAHKREDDSRTHCRSSGKQSRLEDGKESNGQHGGVTRILSARKQEDNRRVQRAQRIEGEGPAETQKQEESEIQRARTAKNQRKLEIEERKRAQEADRQRQQEKDRDRRHRHDDSHDKSKKARRQTAKQDVEPPGPIDPYAAARQAEAKRRELVFAARGAEEADSRTRERPPARDEGPGRLDAERSKPEKTVGEKKATKTRRSRTARGELERYDPRKKFGGGK
ncbi:hypothetical protein CC77DRAFT_79569 [Alternaria alternata]|uniref:Uncharacterized protein n=1 Tax=Alternaria alternata TaxID=5599 RepID=A0A177DN29_ALTAL|nr:hypothetical protein CC77DRAFT_79569 [Alternaria alternata]OAG20758.1 hypothetical protein CC77DRAFT_79569 [Alternaria alternata]